jgi:hypothetical protein
LIREVGNDLRLAITKPPFALDVEYQRNPDPGARLDLVIGIDKRPLQAPRQLTTDSRLARARHPYQVNVIPCIHERIVAAPNDEAGKSRPRFGE